MTMIVYNIFSVLIKLFSLCLFLVFLGLSLYLLYAGTDFSSFMGEIWFFHDSASLNFAQVIVERYLYYPLWFDFIVPYALEQPAYLFLPLAIFGSGFLFYLVSKFL